MGSPLRRLGQVSAFVALPFAALSIGGCYCSHERTADDAGRDAPAVRDAPVPDFLDVAPPDVPAIDVGPDGERYWIAVPPGELEVAVERCELREGQTPIFRVTLVGNACDEPGNVRFSIDPGAQTVTLDPFLWRPVGGPPCPPSTVTYERDVALDGVFLAVGDWRLLVAGTALDLPFRVQAGPPELTCTDCRGPGEECQVDQECAGDRACVAMRGDAVCISRCEAPCEPFPDAPGAADLGCSMRLGTAATCELDPSFGWLCAPATTDLCPPCPAGMRCRSDGDFLAFCEWALSPWDAGSSCTTDADCLAGISCVEDTFGRTCQVRCRGDHPCPFDRCGPSRAVCEIPKI